MKKTYDALIPGLILGIREPDIKDKKSGIFHYVRQDLARTQSMFEWKNLPKNVDQRDLEMMLQTNGHICLAKLDSEKSPGIWAFSGNLGGTPSRTYMPTLYIVANPTLQKSYMFRIHREEDSSYLPEQSTDPECIVIPNDSTYTGLLPMFSRYASLIVENDISMRLADINCRIASLLSADDDGTAESARDFLKKIEDGDLGVVGDESFFEGIKAQPYSPATYSTVMSTLIEYQQYLKASKFNDLGLQANYNMKREAINTSEAQMNDDALLPLAEDMLNCRKKWAKIASDFFRDDLDGEIEVGFSSSWEIRQEEIEKMTEDESTSEIVDGESEAEEEEEKEVESDEQEENL